MLGVDPPMRIRGFVKWFDDEKGFGFIRRTDGAGDVFVHRSGIAGSGQGRKKLDKDQSVEFDIEDGQKGPQAVNVTASA